MLRETSHTLFRGCGPTSAIAKDSIGAMHRMCAHQQAGTQWTERESCEAPLTSLGGFVDAS